MFYTKIKNKNSFILKNTTNNSSAEFYLVAQPIVQPKSRNVVAIEVLTNLISSSNGTIHAEDFFSDISNEFIKSLIMIQIEELNNIKIAINSKNIVASINIPFDLLSDIELIKSIINKSQVKIALEVTNFKNSTVMTDNIKKSVSIIKEHGFELWLDDFTSEDIPSNALYLLKWDRVKIDKTFIYRHINNHSLISDLLNYISNFSFNSIVFEGIESDYQNDQISKFNCLCQGYLYSRPLRLSHMVL
ncbi:MULTISPECIES: EAL domain-containing protein [unclassified Moritella]|uniref:EAL domain-containing protein n=1 Tax=unclassified Moritella TaxID=2637987 RepID=UPI001BAC2407|nr:MULTISPECIES: EAL domain-containing protein [unclassified Moritella]QUM84737.1 EAL domain-containing protein [Moritella sp. 28]QUM88984.1 EAL domain-containing protein [Moritella sp. 36]